MYGATPIHLRIIRLVCFPSRFRSRFRFPFLFPVFRSPYSRHICDNYTEIK